MRKIFTISKQTKCRPYSTLLIRSSQGLNDCHGELIGWKSAYEWDRVILLQSHWQPLWNKNAVSPVVFSDVGLSVMRFPVSCTIFMHDWHEPAVSIALLATGIIIYSSCATFLT